MGQVQFLELNPNPNLNSTKKNQNWPTFVTHFTPYPRTLVEWEMSLGENCGITFLNEEKPRTKVLC
jgi:hypothetical protein